MNKPDNTTIQAWLNGELEGDALREMEHWAEENAEALEREMGWQPLAEDIAEALPKTLSVPHADFFNEQIRSRVSDEPAEQAPVKSASIWQRLNWLIAPAALAGLAIGFYIGSSVDSSPSETYGSLSQELVYTPVSGVSSEVMDSETETVIVLEGLEPIPESIDIVHGESSFGVSPMFLAQLERSELTF